MMRKILATLIRLINKSILFSLTKRIKIFPVLLGSKTYYSQLSKYKYSVQEFHEQTNTLYVARRGRLNLYFNGIDERLLNLQNQYFTSTLDNLPQQSLIVDIGANIGEFSVYWSRQGYDVIAFEPDPIEYACLQQNLPKEQCQNIGLWNRPTTLKFYLDNDTGDSSLFKSKENQKSISIKVDTLDNTLLSYEGVIGLIKLEAEGGEPEILEGSIKTLLRTHYISIDAGLERGLKKESTLKEVCNILFSHGFEICDFNPIRFTLLFKNLQL